MARRLSHGSEGSPNAVGQEDDEETLTIVAVPVWKEAQEDVNMEATMVASERSTSKDAVVVAPARNTQKCTVNNLNSHTSESTGGSVVNTVTPSGANSGTTGLCEASRDSNNNAGIITYYNLCCANPVVVPPFGMAVTVEVPNINVSFRNNNNNNAL